jgi:hypothetical protein
MCLSGWQQILLETQFTRTGSATHASCQDQPGQSTAACAMAALLEKIITVRTAVLLLCCAEGMYANHSTVHGL